MLAYLSAQYLATGELPARTGNQHPIAAPYGLFEAADGQVAIAPSTDEVVRRLFTALDIEPMLDRPEFSSYEARLRHRDAVSAVVGERIRLRPVDHWIAVLNDAGVPCGRVSDLRAVFSDPQVLAQEMVLQMEHPGHGTVRMTGFPVKLGATPCRLRLPAPELGADTDAVLTELGLGDQIATLRERGIV
jgi:crotonobetainyl-CoA:carnitine CoA-transferase CaiB-like acyl-CoA transferase